MKIPSLRPLIGLTALLLLTSAAQAASIAWATGPSYDGPNGFEGILTNGSLVAAYDLATATPQTVDPTGINLTFTPIDHPAFTAFIFSSGSPGSTDVAWNSIVDSTEWTSGDFTAPNFLTGPSLPAEPTKSNFLRRTLAAAAARVPRLLERPRARISTRCARQLH